MTRILRFFLALFLCMLASGIFAVVYGLFAPRIEIGDRALALVKYLIDADWLELKDARILIVADSLLKKRLFFSAGKISLHLSDVDFSAEKVDFAAELILRWQGSGFTTLGPIKSDEVVIVLHPLSEDSTTPFQDKRGNYLTALSTIRYEEISIKSLIFTTKGDNIAPIKGQGSLHLTGLNQHRSDILTYKFYNLGGMGITSLKGELFLANYRSIFDLESQIEGWAATTFHQGSIAGSATISFKKTQGRMMKMKVSAVTDGLRITGNLVGEFDPGKMDSRLDVTIFGRHDPTQRVSFSPCTLRLGMGEGTSEGPSYKLSCQGELQGGLPASLQPVAALLDHSLRFRFQSAGTLKHRTPHDVLVHETKLSLATTTAKEHSVQISGEAAIRGSIPLGLFNAHDTSSSFRLKLSTKHFEKVVASLAATPLAILAPINQLSGKVSCQLEGHDLVFSMRKLKFPLDCKVDLNSPDQSLVLTGSGYLGIVTTPGGIHPSLDLLVDVYSVDFVLPHIELTSPLPKLTLDKRIILGQSGYQPPMPSDLAYDITVRTHTPGAIRLISNLTNHPLPLSIDAAFSDKTPLTGKVLVKDWPVDFMRRRAVVERFRLDLTPNQDGMPIDGRIKINSPQYVITLGLLGTLEQPRYFLQSEPPLTQRELLAVLLFGKEPDFLDPDKLQSVENTSAALADGMISLVSMYYLASSPIESIGYNPMTKLFSATIDLPHGVSMVVGTSGQDLREIGLRKSLGRGFSLETKTMQNDDTGSTHEAAMLRWRFSY